MKSFRSILSLIACALLALGASQSAHAANTVSASVATPLPTGPGQTFGVSLDISTDSPTQHVSGFYLKVYYDDTQVTLTGCSNNTGEASTGYFLDAPIPSPQIAGLNAFKYILMSTLHDLIGPGPIGQVNFTTRPGFTGTVRIAVLPGDEPDSEEGLTDEIFHVIPVTYSIPDPLFDGPANVYVYKGWAGATAGDSVITPAPDSITAVYGVNAFDTVQGGVNAVDAGAKVMVYDGGFEAEAVTIAKSLIFEGRAPAPPSPTVSSIDLDAGAVVTDSIGVTADTVNVNANNVLIADGILVAKNDPLNRATVTIADDVYAQSNVVVDKAIILAGQSRAGAIIVPAAEDGNKDNAFADSAQNGIIIKSSDVMIKNLTLNGQGNPGLTPGKNNFRIGIVSADASYPGGGTWNNLHVDGVDVRHPYRRGISVWPPAVSGTLIENSLIDDVRFNQGMAVAGQGEILNNTINHAFQGIVLGPDPTTPAGICKVNGNTLTDIGNSAGCWGYPNGQPRGIQFNNSDSVGREVEIKNNTISDNGLEQYSGAVGIYTRLPNSDSVVEGNNITLSSGVSWAEPGSQAVGMLLGWSYAKGFLAKNNQINMTKYGIGVMVHGSGSTANPLVLEGNTITSTLSAALETGDGTGIYIANEYLFAPTDRSLSHVILQNNNVISGFVRGVAIEKLPAASQALTLIADGNSISGNSGAGIASVGSGSGVITLSATNNTINGNATGLSASGAALATVTGNTMYGNPVQFAFDSGVGTAATVNTFAMADRLPADLELIIDANTLTGKVYIGEGSPFTLVRAESGYLNVRNRIQPSATAATEGDTVRCPGDAVAARVTYPEQVSANKALTFLGEPGDTTVAGPAATAPIVDGQNVAGNGFSMVSAADDVAVRGFFVRNHASGGDNATGAGVWTSTDSDRITVADCDIQACANGAVFGWVDSSTTLDGWNIAYNTINVPTTSINGAIDLTNMINTTINHNTVVGGISNLTLASDSNSAGPTGLGSVVSDNSLSGAPFGKNAVSLSSFNLQPLMGVVIKSNNITPPASGYGVYISPNNATFPISDITIGGTGPGDGNIISGSCNTAVYGYGGYGPLSNLTVSGNTIAITNSNSLASAVNFYNVAGSSIMEANTISKSGSSVGAWYGVQVSRNGTGAIQIHRNTINGGSSAGTSGAGLYLANTLTASASITATENIITGFLGTSGRAVRTQALVNSSVLTLHGNDLSGNTRSVQNGGSAVLDASSNWHGTNTEAGVQGQVLTLVDYTPWLDVATDTDAVTAGFQGDFSYLHVAAASPQTGAIGRIQEGVDLLADGALTGNARTAYLHNGTFVESNCTIGRACTVQGESRAGVVIAPAAEDSKEDSAYGGSSQSGLILSSGDITVLDLTVDGEANNTALGRPADENNFRSGIIDFAPAIHNNLQIRNCVVKGIVRRGIQLGTWVRTLPSLSTGHLVQDCVISDVMYRHGIAMSADGVIRHNEVSNINQTSSFVGSAIYFEGDNMTVENNTVTDFGLGGIWFAPNYGAADVLSIRGNSVSQPKSSLTLCGLYLPGLDSPSVIGGPSPLDRNTIDMRGGDALVDERIGVLLTWVGTGVVFENNLVRTEGIGTGLMSYIAASASNRPVLRNNQFVADLGIAGSRPEFGSGILVTDDGEYINGPGSSGATYLTLENNEVTGFARGIDVLNSGASAARPAVAMIGGLDSTFSNEIVNCETGVLVHGQFANATIPNNSVYDNETGIGLAASATATIESNDFDDAADNLTDIRLDADAGLATFAGTTALAGDTYLVDNRAAQAIDATGFTFDVTGDFNIEDHMFHALDASASGLITWVANNVFVTDPARNAPGVLASTDSVVQRGVDASAAGFTVNVEAGSYAQSATVDKAVTVVGALAGVDARTRSGAESTLTGGFSVTVDDVTLDGLKVAGAANAVTVAGGLTGVTAKNISIDTVSGNGIYAGAAGNLSELIADKNLVVGVGGVGIGGYLANSIVTNNLVSSSTVEDATGIGGQFAVATIEGNEVDSITSGSAFALLYDQSTGTLVQLNRFNHSAHGVYVDAAAPPDPSVLLTRNHISEEVAGGFGAANITASTLTANGNWWGHVFGPLATAASPLNNATGRGTEVTGAVAFDPWYIERDLALTTQALRALNDRDGDGIWDADEDDNLNNVLDAGETDRAVKDTDGDGVEDGVERVAGTDPRNNLSVPAGLDSDGDGLPASIDPNDGLADTDGDRFLDGYEYSHGTDPSIAASKPALGDVNNDGDITIFDVSRLTQVLVASRPVTDGTMYLDYADMNRNGNVSNADATILRRFVGGPTLQPTLPF
ncbi:hypothetical protein CVU37_13040 [candidate division BRC1 bacterium HGW-BRC1-1]|jgi:hypothetical protein|nr:MAG: hypothetical protein CVU37_13040 [candidate division BRC1 bacterium HGW-BRC1-1]